MLNSVPLVCAVTIAILLMLGFDYMFKDLVYDRTDPLSLAMLSFGVLLVMTDAVLQLARLTVGQTVDLHVFVWAVGVLVVCALVAYLVGLAHRQLLAEQRKRVTDFLDELRAGLRAEESLRPNHPVFQDALWRALEELGHSKLEPDAYERIPRKKEKRITFLKTVRALTEATHLNPERDQIHLVIDRRSPVRPRAKTAYVVAALVGLSVAVFYGAYLL